MCGGGLFKFRRLTSCYDLLLSSLRKFFSSDESSVHEAVGFRMQSSGVPFSPQQSQLPRRHTTESAGGLSRYVFIRPISTPLHYQPREPLRTYNNPVEKLRLPPPRSTSSQEHVDSRWGQPVGLCRKEKWPRGHM